MKEEKGLPGMLGATRVGPGFICLHPGPGTSRPQRGSKERKGSPRHTGPSLGPGSYHGLTTRASLVPSAGPKGHAVEPPHSLWEASLLFQQKHLGAGEATGQKRGVEGAWDSQPKTRVPTCPRACGKSLSCFGPQSPHPYREGRELDKGSPTQTPSGSRWNSAPKRVPGMCRPGAARTFGFEKQSEKSGFLCVITSSLNIRKTFSGPMKQESGPELAHGPPLRSGLQAPANSEPW